MKWGLALLLLSFCVFPCHANLGETVAQCVTRYGTPVHFTEANGKSPFGTVTFAAGEYILMIFLSNGHEVGAKVSKADKSDFSDADRQTIMSVDASSPWSSIPSDDPTCLAWTRADKAKVLYDKEKHLLIFTSAEMAQILDAQTKKSP